MRDKISEQRIELLHPAVRVRFRSFIEDAESGLDMTIRIVQGMRTFAEQQAIYDQGRTLPGKIVTNAKPGSSFHNYGLAIDVVQVLPGAVNWNLEYQRLLPYASGIKWGGSFRTFKDTPHFEITFGLAWRELLARYQAKDFIPGTEFVRI